MDDKQKSKYFQYYRDYCFFKKIEVNRVEDLARESLEKGFNDLYAFIMTLLCRYSLENQRRDNFCDYLSDLKIVANTEGGFPAVHAYINEGYYQMMVEQNYQNAIKYFQTARNIYEEHSLHNPPTLFLIFQYLGVSYWNISDDIIAYKYFTEALKCNLNKTFRFHKAMTYNWLAIIETEHHLISQALEKSLRSAKILKNYAIEIRYCDVMNTIGLLYLDLKKFDDAKTAFTESLKIALKHNVSFIIADAYNNIGLFYYRTNQPYLSIEQLQKSIEHRNHETDQRKYGFTLMNLCCVYMFLEDFPMAEKYIFEAMKIAKKFDDTVFLTKCNLNVAMVYHKTKDYPKTKSFLSLCEQYALKANNIDILIDIYKAYIDLYHDTKRYKKKKKYEILYTEMLKKQDEMKQNNIKNFLEAISGKL